MSKFLLMQNHNKWPSTYLIPMLLWVSGCAYFNTFYNAQQYFRDAENIRITKGGTSVPVSAMDKYGKTIKKCETVLKDYPESKYRTDAVLLMAISRYYRGEYDQAQADLNDIKINGSDQEKEEAFFWQALCKAKKGNLSVALGQLNELLNNSSSPKILAKCHNSLANIYEEIDDHETALYHLMRAGEMTKEKGERALIYGKLAQKAYDKDDYDLALDGYKKVIAQSQSKENVEKSHLQVLKILRIQNNFQDAEKKIKSMLINDKFRRIYGDLELELVQLYKAQGQNSEIESRLESIVNSYQRTTVSAEAYYQLGQIYTSEKWNPEKAKGYYEMVSKEYSRSLFSPLARGKLNSIKLYEDASDALVLHENIINASIKNDKVDTTSLAISQEKTPDRSIPELYYQIADLEAFSFNRHDKSIDYLKKILEEFPLSEFAAKARFTMVHIYNSRGDIESANTVEKELFDLHPNSDYVKYLDPEFDTKPNLQESLMVEAESILNSNPTKAVKLYKSALSADSLGKYADVAAFAVGHYYDQEAILDSALKYYEWFSALKTNTEYSEEAFKRLATIRSVMQTLNPDTLKNEPLESD